MGGSLIGFVQQLSQFIVGPFGISVITLAIGMMAIHAAISERGNWDRVGRAVVAGAILFSSGWIVTTFLA